MIRPIHRSLALDSLPRVPSRTIAPPESPALPLNSDRIAPEKREAFLKSRAELLAIVLHLDNFAAVIDGITIGLSPRSENARNIDTARREVQALTEAVRS